MRFLGNKLKINFAGMKKVLTFAIPNGNRFKPDRRREAAGMMMSGV